MKFLNYTLLMLPIAMASFSSVAHAQAGVGGGNIEEQQYIQRQDLLKKSILRGDLVNLKMRDGMSNHEWSHKMLRYLPPDGPGEPGEVMKFPPVLIHFTKNDVTLADGSPKACRSWVGEDPQHELKYQPDAKTLAMMLTQGITTENLGHTLCNSQLYTNVFSDLEKLQQTAHETAVLAKLEDPEGSPSTYPYSGQLSLEATPEVVYKVVVKALISSNENDGWIDEGSGSEIRDAVGKVFKDTKFKCEFYRDPTGFSKKIYWNSIVNLFNGNVNVKVYLNPQGPHPILKINQITDGAAMNDGHDQFEIKTSADQNSILSFHYVSRVKKVFTTHAGTMLEPETDSVVQEVTEGEFQCVAK
jgi:hypothetical protein